MLNKYLFRRYLLFAIALFVNAMGIAYITKAALGTSPITSVTYVASMFTPLTMGQWTIVLNRGHLLGEMLAKRLGIRLYDKEFIHLAAQKSGIDEAYIRSNEQSIPSFWLKCILTDGNESSRQQGTLCRLHPARRSQPHQGFLLFRPGECLPTMHHGVRHTGRQGTCRDCPRQPQPHRPLRILYRREMGRPAPL